ncbi:unnamed protein product, partial [Polarella glacialis]
ACGFCRRRAPPPPTSRLAATAPVANSPVPDPGVVESEAVSNPDSAYSNEWEQDQAVLKELDALGLALGDRQAAVACATSLKFAELRALRLLAEQASHGIDYRSVGQGWQKGHPMDRLSYREGKGKSCLRAESQLRSKASVEALQKICSDLGANPAGAASAISATFVREIGADQSLGSSATFEGVLKSLEAELLMPLRSLNEDQRSMSKSFPGLDLPTEEIRKTVAAITRNVLQGTFKQWRYSNP